MSICRKDDLVLLVDFETTGFADCPESEPIEIAGLLIDHKLNILAQYESFIQPDNREDKWGWDEREWKAYEIHGIEPEALYSAPSKQDVAKMINSSIRSYSSSRVYLMSDNSYFDMTFAKRLGLKLHYNPLDAKTLTSMANVERQESKNKKHRAMNDVLNLYRSLVIAWDRLTVRKGA